MREIMREQTLIKICFFMSIAGIAIMYIAAVDFEGIAIEISQITNEMNGETVVTCGIVTEKSLSSKGTVFLTLEDTEAIQVVFFSNLAATSGAYEIDEGSEQCIEGQIDIYNGALEIIANKIISREHVA